MLEVYESCCNATGSRRSCSDRSRVCNPCHGMRDEDTGSTRDTKMTQTLQTTARTPPAVRGDGLARRRAQVLPDARRAARRAARRVAVDRAGRVARDRRAQRLGQEHAAQHPRHARPPDERLRHARRRRPVRALRQRRSPSSARRASGSSSRTTTCCRSARALENVLLPKLAAGQGDEGRHGPRGGAARAGRPGRPRVAPARASCPAASGSASPSPGR